MRWQREKPARCADPACDYCHRIQVLVLWSDDGERMAELAKTPEGEYFYRTERFDEPQPNGMTLIGTTDDTDGATAKWIVEASVILGLRGRHLGGLFTVGLS